MPNKPLYDKKKRRRLTATRTKYLTKPKSINDLLSNSVLLREQSRTFAPQEAWRDWLRQQLPAQLASHLNSVALKAGQLQVFTETAVWSSRLRYALAELEGAITERNGSALRLSVRVKPGAAG